MIKFYLPLCLALTTNAASGQTPEKVKFRIDLNSELGNIKSLDRTGVRGNTAPLSWDKTWYLSDPDKNGIWEGEITFENVAPNTIIEYKYIHDDAVWESTDNRLLIVGKTTAGRAVEQWNEVQMIAPQDFPLLTREQLQADFKIAQKALVTLHPGLERYNSRSETDKTFKHFETLFQKEWSHREVYWLYSKLLATIRCGHTYANFSNQNLLIKKLVFNQPDKLPFCFRILDKKVIVTHNLSDNEQFIKGTEITAINQIPVGEILDSLLTVVKADGYNDAKRLNDLELSGLGKFESFDVYFPLFFPPVNGQFKITALQPADGNTPFVESVPAISRDNRKKLLLEKYQLKESPLDEYWKFEILDAQTAYLRSGTFVTWQMKMDWQDFLKNSFAEIKARNIQNLILDIRGNEGGNDDVILELVKYLASKDLTFEKSQTLVRYTAVPDDLLPFLSSWDNDFKDLSGKTSPTGQGFFELKNKGNLTSLAAQKKSFKGKTIVLMNAANSSATFLLVKILKDNQLATLAGQTTGGSQRGLNGGQTAFLRLPNSGIELDIPLYGTFFEGKPAKGIEPDILILPNKADIISDTDTELEFIKKWIKDQK